MAAPSERTHLLEDQDEDSYETTYISDEDNTQSTAFHRGTFARNLGALDGFALLISIVIGSGVFSSPGPIDANVPSPGVGLLVWLVGGILAWTGALTMAELGTAFPGEGGIQPYLSYIYGDVWGYMAAWSWIVATMPATLAILSIVFVESIYSSMGINEPEPPITHKLLSLLVLVCVTTLNSISTKTSTRLSGFFVAIKLFTILLLIVAGLVAVFVFVGKKKDYGGGDWHSNNWFAPRDTVLPDGTHFDWSKVTTWESLGFYSTALYGALWAYSGWDKVWICDMNKWRTILTFSRQITWLPNSATRANNFHYPSTLLSRPSYSVMSPLMQSTTFSYLGKLSPRQMPLRW
jgi:L-type amino acid transporter 9